MPFYEIHHSYPLSASQKQSLATSITSLHATTFTTPSLFVNVKFTACDASDQTYFVAGSPKTVATNRVVGMVRTSSSRSKNDFDTLAGKIEEAWYDAVLGEIISDEKSKDKGKRKIEVDKDFTASQKDATKLLFVGFVPLITVREQGLTIPEAGQEGKWFKENLDDFRRRGDAGDEDIEAMVKELDEREDLRKLMGAGGGAGAGVQGVVDGVKNMVVGGRDGQQQGGQGQEEGEKGDAHKTTEEKN